MNAYTLRNPWIKCALLHISNPLIIFFFGNLFELVLLHHARIEGLTE